MKALDILEKELIGSFISRFSVGDTWELFFGHYWLVCQNIISKDEDYLNRLILKNYESANTTIDKEYIPKSLVITANMRKLVNGLKLDDKYNLTINFEGGDKIMIPSNEKIVDWQWCFNETGNNPYQDYLVACFFEGEIKINP